MALLTASWAEAVIWRLVYSSMACSAVAMPAWAEARPAEASLGMALMAASAEGGRGVRTWSGGWEMSLVGDLVCGMEREGLTDGHCDGKGVQQA